MSKPKFIWKNFMRPQPLSLHQNIIHHWTQQTMSNAERPSQITCVKPSTSTGPNHCPSTKTSSILRPNTQKHRLQSKYSPLTPQDTAAAYSNYSKAGRSRRMAKRRAKASNGLQAAPKSWFRARVENGLQRGKRWWLPMVGGHWSVAKGVGERAKQPEGLYLGCRPRYSCRKRLPGWASWSRCLFDKKWGDVWLRGMRDDEWECTVIFPLLI
jgi:hypothetical protein